jgi:DNA polymerase III subunit delta'
MTIVGHDGPIGAFLAGLRSGRLHHGWLMSGPEGIGKARVAQALAKRILCDAAGPKVAGDALDVADDHPVGKLVEAGTHPDLIVVERLPKDMKPLRDVARKDWPEDVERARNITIDQVRALGGVFALTPSYSQSRVVIVDSIDDMERAAANALLKSLEEPPRGTIFLLVSHAPGRLLPTIRSRCRVLRFEALDDAATRTVLQRQRPGEKDAEIEALVRAGQGSPGRALGYSGLDLAELENALNRIAQTGDPQNALRATLAQSLSGKSAQRRYEAFLARTPSFIAEHAKDQRGLALKRALEAWDGARTLGENALRQSLEPQMTIFALAAHVASLAVGQEGAKA